MFLWRGEMRPGHVLLPSVSVRGPAAQVHAIDYFFYRIAENVFEFLSLLPIILFIIFLVRRMCVLEMRMKFVIY